MKNGNKSSKPSSEIKIVFFGSGPVAADSLRLLNKKFDVEAIITKPSTEQDMQTACPDAPVHVVNDRKTLSMLVEQQKFSSSVAVLIDFGIIVSRDVIGAFPKGIINSHFSLLPKLRGADPISFAILEGNQETGVSLMLLVEAMDEGPLLASEGLRLDTSETTPSLTAKLIELSYHLLVKYVDSYLSGDTQSYKQKGSPTYTRKLSKADGIIDWTKPAEQLEREVRAFLEWPKSKVLLGSIDCVITRSSVLSVEGAAGELFIHDGELAVYCGQDALLIQSLKPAGKQEMTSQAFLAGYRARLGL